MSIELKKLALAHCLQHIVFKIDQTNEAIRLLQQSANEETKSSAGDKYETGRAMAQLEIEKLLSQVAELKKQKQTLDQIDISKSASPIHNGSLVITDQGVFFLSVSIGQIKAGGTSLFCISSSSPIGNKLLGLHKRESFSFNNKTYAVLDVF
jgi:hypothetical protein